MDQAFAFLHNIYQDNVFNFFKYKNIMVIAILCYA